MIKIKPEEFNKELLKIMLPIRTKIGYNVNFKYENNDFKFQTPVCKIIEIDPEKYYKIQIPYRYKQHYNFLHSIEEKAMDFVIDMAPFIKTLDNNILNIKINSKTLIFDKNKNQITKYDIKAGDKIISMIDTKGIWIDDFSSTLRWNALEIMKITEI